MTTDIYMMEWEHYLISRLPKTNKIFMPMLDKQTKQQIRDLVKVIKVNMLM